MDKKAGHAALPATVDVVVVGAGFSGMYLITLMRDAGLSVVVLEQGSGVGGTWYWNRYPGARCDVESVQYSHKYLPDLEQEWNWSERYAAQPEILAYAQEIADRQDLYSDICFDQRVVRAEYDEASKTWGVETENGGAVTARFFIMATGCLSVPNEVAFEGRELFKGSSYQTGRWPHKSVDFSGQNVAVIGTGSSAIQSIPAIAKQAAKLTVFQRTANYAVPAQNRLLDDNDRAEYKQGYAELRAAQKKSFSNMVGRRPQGPASERSLEEQLEEYQRRWEEGSLLFNAAFTDVMTDKRSNDIAADFVRAKIRERVTDPETGNLLCPTNILGAKRLCLDIGYFETYNLPHVDLVDISKASMSISETGVVVGGRTYDVDAIVYATGFDAMTGAILSVDIRGRDGKSIHDHWADGPQIYLGLAISGFPNLFTVTGPASPSVLTNMIPTLEQHCEWIATCIQDLLAQNLHEIEAEEPAERAWMQHNHDIGAGHLRPSSPSWYTGENIQGKPTGFMPYIGSMPQYREKCEAVVANGYEGFRRT